jgi:hypothetical protein
VFRVFARLCGVATKVGGFCEGQTPRQPVATERSGREPQQERALLVVQEPHGVPVRREEGHECCGIDLARGGLDDRTGPGQVSAREEHEGLVLDEVQRVGRHGQCSVGGFQRLGVAA